MRQHFPRKKLVHCLQCQGHSKGLYNQNMTNFLLHLLNFSHSGELQTQKLKSHLVRTQSLNVLPLKPGVGQYIAIHATLTAGNFFLAYVYPSGPFTCIFSKPLPISPVLAVANTWFLCRPAEWNRLPAGCRFPCWVPAEYIYRLKKHNLWCDDLWNE